MNIRERILWIAAVVLLLGAADAQAQATDAPPLAVPQRITAPQQMDEQPPPPEAQPEPEPEEEDSFKVTGRYTAQRRPRVTVGKFEDTNTEAQQTRYGSSVEAMLVTFLKRKSQFVVVEREKIGGLLEEKRRIQGGMVDVEAGDQSARALFEKLDAYIIGSVTVLNIPTEQKTAPKAERQPGEKAWKTIQGPRIEVDAKLLSRFDGRIIAAAQRSGPVACIRTIVERLGTALEQEFLRPYYGKLKINLTEPRNVRIFLTPILLDKALDEEKPPVERSATVTIGTEFDTIDPWTTNPTTYLIEDLLSGWYTMRLERPGYEGVKPAIARWEARNIFGQAEVYESRTGLPLDQTDFKDRRFVVRVDPLQAEAIDADKLKFVFRKKTGSLVPLVSRQYLDTDFTSRPKRVILMGGKKLEINHVERLKEYADDERCDLFVEKEFTEYDYGGTYVAFSQKFDIDKFKGGELIIEDYQGEQVPVGEYEMALWEPYYGIERISATVVDLGTETTQTPLLRQTLSLNLEATGRRPANQAFLEGRDTHLRIPVPLDFTDTMEQPGLPVDVFTVSTNIPGLEAWQQSVELLPGNSTPPIYDKDSPDYEPQLLPRSTENQRPATPPTLRIKTRFGLAGRLDVFSQSLDPLAADLFIDEDVLKILNLLLYGREERPKEEPGALMKVAAEVGRTAVQILDETIIQPNLPNGSTTASAVAPPAPAAQQPENTPPPPPPPPRLPRDRDELRKLLALRLQSIDLLVLDPKDMTQLRKSPEVAPLIEKYVAAGGALFAYISETGDYGGIIGAPLAIDSVSKPTDRFQLAPGQVTGIVPQFDKKKMDVKSKRALPEIAKLPPSSWRVLAFTQGQKNPRIIEYGRKEEGGYVALWLDDPDAFQGRLGGTVPKVQETRANLEERVMNWARLLMY
ncbi:MAG TPA: CsgG/HfaB family protein, partial [Thermoanaerobaculia bacterium]|nr:CsgG/HfaB family protein [Thermoanaerobaculia bacterium]